MVKSPHLAPPRNSESGGSGSSGPERIHSQTIQPGSLSEQAIQAALDSTIGSHVLIGLHACTSIKQVPPKLIKYILSGATSSMVDALIDLCLDDHDEILKLVYPPRMGGYPRPNSNGESLTPHYRIKAAQVYRTKWPCDPVATNILLDSSDYDDFLVGCALAHAQTSPDINLLINRLRLFQPTISVAALDALLSREDLASEHPEIMQQIFANGPEQSWITLRRPAMELCRKYQHLDAKTVGEWLEHSQWSVRAVAMATCCNCPAIPAELIERGARDPNDVVRIEAARAMAGRNDISCELIQQLLNDFSYKVCLATAESCLGNQSIPMDTLNDWWHRSSTTRTAALYAYTRRMQVPFQYFMDELKDVLVVRFETLRMLLERRRWLTQMQAQAQAEAILQRETLPPGLLLPLLYADGEDMRNLAHEVRRAYNVQLPITQEPLPPDRLVYKACMNNVRVTAYIPADAQVRQAGTPEHFRASKAKIVAVDGNFYGDNVGISYYDYSTIYRVGDLVEIPNFDMRPNCNGAGFYFVCSPQELG